jgi:NADH-quinone oxidoreductase subunit B
VAGTITEKMAPILVRIYQQMLEPSMLFRWVLVQVPVDSIARIMCSKAADKVIPVDVYVPGCPPTPEAVLDGSDELQKMINQIARLVLGATSGQSPFEI